MAKIKIISNPYQKVTVFQSWDDATAQWVEIDRDQNADSQLLREELCVGFFPFKAKQIVDVIIHEYSAGSEKVEIVFEGTDDEYLELDSICSQDDYPDRINLYKSGRYLENARDILPDVIDVFKELSPLVAESVSDKAKIKRELEKFSDASNDVIPICVIGNYSSGKSTFINALIGYELLPSSDEPTTAKIYKISQSKHPDRATIKFEYGYKSVRIRFSADSYKFLTDPEDNPLVVKLKKLLDEIAGESIPSKLNKVLDVINGFANREKNESISDLIEIEVPFDEDGIWGKIWNNFVIFDTPGSNSASNVKHYEVLKKAMEDFITYHEKKEITIPFSERSLRNMNYVEAGDRLQELGFTEIYEKPIRDLVTGWVKKDGAVEKVTIDSVHPFKKNSVFSYDVEITIEYHTFKKK